MTLFKKFLLGTAAVIGSALFLDGLDGDIDGSFDIFDDLFDSTPDDSIISSEGLNEKAITAAHSHFNPSFGNAHGHCTTWYKNEIESAIKDGYDPNSSKIRSLEEGLADSIADDAVNGRT